MARKSDKHRKEEVVEGMISVHDFTGPIEGVILLLQQKKDDAVAKGYDQIRVEVDDHYDYTDYKIVGMRDETKEEREKRLKKQKSERERRKKQREDSEAADRALYESLKARFEKDDQR